MTQQTPTLNRERIKKLTFYEKKVRVSFAEIAGKKRALVCANSLFTAIFGTKNKHIQLKNLRKECSCDAELNLSNKTFDFYTIDKLSAHLNSVKIPVKTLINKPENYQNYLHFFEHFKGISFVQDNIVKMFESAEIEKFDVYARDVSEFQEALRDRKKSTIEAHSTDSKQQTNFEAQLKQKEEQIKELKQEQNNLEQNLRIEQSTVSEQKKEVENLQAQIEELKKSNNQKISSLSEEKEVLEQDIKEKQESLTEASRELTEINKKLSEKEKEVLKLQNCLNEHKRDEEQSKEAFNSITEKVKALSKTEEQQKQRIKELENENAQLIKDDEARKADWFRSWLLSKKTSLKLTLFAILAFLPFTVSNLTKYIAIETSATWQEWLVFALCLFVAFCWDFAILVFSVVGREKMAIVGACFQFIFVAAKFNYLERVGSWVFKDGMYFQDTVVITSICFYTPLLVIKLARLSK